MKKYLYLLILTILFLVNNVSGQSVKKTIIQGHFYTVTDEIENLSITKLGMRSHLGYNPDYRQKLTKDKTFKIQLNIDNPSFYKIGDLWHGHIIFIEPSDSLNITLSPLKDAETRRQKGEIISKDYVLTTSSKYYGNIIFYDELEKKIGTATKYNFESPENYRKKCDETYNYSITLLEFFKAKKAISDNFYQYAKEDLKARYLLSFCGMLARKDKNNMLPSVWSSFQNLKFDNDLYYTSCNSYSMAPYVYNYYIANSFNPYDRTQNFVSEFNSILENYTGLIRDRTLGWEITDYLDKKQSAFDSCYAIFLKTCVNQKIKAEVIKKVKNYVPLIKKVSALNFDDILNRTKVEEYKKDKVSFKSILSDSLPTLIDCWASWCVPCKVQMPFVNDVEKRYAHRLKVVYLSFDEEDIKWNNYLKKSEYTHNQYLVDNDLDSELAKFFGIDLIPRYILISPKGTKILNDKMPLPALTEEFEIELKKYLK
jgi:thiol-disulfide isomerase/thioredoxin